jgi:2-phospho-L-lactate guanylyltransferase
VRTVAVVPVKTLAAAKTRLAGALAPEQRADLTLQTLRRVLAALDQPGVAARLVVSPDQEVLRAARIAGAHGLHQASDGLNPGLEEARAWALAHHADALMIVLGDLPLLAPEQVAAILALAGHPGTVVLAPDRHGSGTNIMLLRPPEAIPLTFGQQSLHRHRAAAQSRGLTIHTYTDPATALDLDTPDDLAALSTLLTTATTHKGHKGEHGRAGRASR